MGLSHAWWSPQWLLLGRMYNAKDVNKKNYNAQRYTGGGLPYCSMITWRAAGASSNIACQEDTRRQHDCELIARGVDTTRCRRPMGTASRQHWNRCCMVSLQSLTA